MTPREAAEELLAGGGVFSGRDECEWLLAQEPEGLKGFFCDLWSRDAELIARLVLAALEAE